MSLSDLPLLIPLPVLLLLSGFFSASETALFGMSVGERLRLARTHPRAAHNVERLLANPRALLVSVLLANMTINVLYFVLASVILLHTDNRLLGIAFNLLSLAAIVLFGEVLAKLAAGSQRTRFCAAFAGLLLGVHRAVAPLRTVLEVGVIGPLTRLVRPASNGPGPLTIEELSTLLELGTSEGAFDPDEERLLARVVEMGVVRAREVMIPRVELASLDADDNPEEVKQVVARAPLTEIPVHEGRLDTGAIGFLDVKRYLATLAGGGTPAIRDCLKPVRYVPEQATLDRALEHLHAHGAAQALCVDEHGTVVGLIAVEDIVELLLEAGPDESGAMGTPDLRVLGPGRWEAPGRLGVRAWASLFPGTRIDPRVSTLGGLVVAMLGRLPTTGDVVTIGNVRLEVGGVDGVRVERVLISLTPDANDAGERAGGVR